MATYARKKQERGLLFSCPEWSSLFFLFYSFSCFLLSPITLALPCSVSRLSYFSLIHRARWVIRGRREMVDLAANLNKYGHARPKERWTKGRELGSASETSLRNAWVRTSRCGKFISFSHYRHSLIFFSSIQFYRAQARSIDHFARHFFSSVLRNLFLKFHIFFL